MQDAPLWPVHPHPLPDEILSSWMVRIAQANGFKVQCFYALHLGRDRPIWNRDIDHFAPDWLIACLERGTGHHAERIRSTTLRSMVGIAFERLNEAGNTRWVLPIGVYHRTRKAFGQQFCPCCIETDETPYYRLRWRLGLTMICCRHGVLMQDRCHACGKALSFHRVDVSAGRNRMVYTAMRLCAYCRQPIAGPVTQATEDALSMQMDIDQALNNGYREIDGAPIYSHLFFEGLRLLLMGATRNLHRHRSGPRQFEYCDAAERLRRLQVGYDLLTQWPARFLEYAAAIPQAYTVFKKDAEPPWWIEKVLRHHLFEGRAKLSLHEAHAIFEASGGVSFARARRLSGRDVRSVLPAHATEIITDDEADQVFAELDRTIALEIGPRRAMFIRDKMMLLVARCWKMSTFDIGCLPVEPHFATCASITGFQTNSKDAKDLKAAMAWFAQEIRPTLTLRKDGALFTSLRGGPLARESVRMRLILVVKKVQLRQEAQQWAAWTSRSAAPLSTGNSRRMSARDSLPH